MTACTLIWSMDARTAGVPLKNRILRAEAEAVDARDVVHVVFTRLFQKRLKKLTTFFQLGLLQLIVVFVKLLNSRFVWRLVGESFR